MINSISSRQFIRNLFGCFKSGTKSIVSHRSASQYKLLEKTDKISVEKFPNNSWVIPEKAKTYTFVKIGKKNDENYNREVTTFYDEKGNLVRRCFRGSGINNRIREYNNDFFLARKGIELNGACGVNRRSIKTSEYVFAEVEAPYIGSWKPVSDEEQFVYFMFDKTKDYKSARKIHINKNQYKHDGTKEHVKATCVEYPMTLGFETLSDKKVLSMDIMVDNNRVKIEGVNPETNVEVPLNDEFLAYRMLVGDKKQECLAQYFLDKKGVGDLNISIETNKSKVNENASAYFSSGGNEIVFKQVQKYGHPVSTSAHEAEHAYQYSQIGRLGRAKTYYERKCRWNKGPLKDINEIKEAKKYAEARDNYPVLDSKEDLSKNKDYLDNYLEVNARLASKKAVEIYEIGHKKLMDIFKYVGGYSSL